jgi:Type I phosphodiesterase / nucleotide pyrophosphatase
MSVSRFVLAGAAVALMLSPNYGMAADTNSVGSKNVKHVLLLSIDGMHAVDFYNCSHGIAGANSGDPYCPNLAALAKTGINYVATSSSKPSDSAPGLMALVTGGTPRTTGIYYDVAFDRTLDGPQITTGTGLAAAPCTPGAAPTGTTTDNDQGIDLDDTMLNGGGDSGAGSIDPKKLSRNPAAGCAAVYPWNFLRTNTIFGVIHAAGGYTAWIDKHPSYAMVAGPGGTGLDDYYAPEVDSNVVALPGVKTSLGASCATVRDATAPSWNASFEDIQCYDALRVDALLNEIAGKSHNGSAATTPAIMGMNFQAVYTGESVSEPGVGVGGYQNAAALPSAELLQEIESVDTSIGDIVNALKDRGIYDDTLIIITAKHGGSPIDPTRYVADGANTPATLMGTRIPFSESPLNPTGIGATEDDVSVLWLNKGESVPSAVELLEQNAAAIGLGQIYYGPTLALNYGVGGWEPGQDPRTPDIIVTPNVGVTYSGSTTMIADHGGFAHDDTNVMLLVSLPCFQPQTIFAETATTQVAPTIVKALGLNPSALTAVKAEGTPVLPEVWSQLAK